MIVGSKRRFGIEFQVDAAKQGDPQLAEWQYGRIRWWCGGTPVGLYEPDTTLRDLATHGARLLLNAGKRQNSDLMTRSATDVMRTIVRALYEDHGQSEAELQADESRYRRLLVGPQVEVFGPLAHRSGGGQGDRAADLVIRRQQRGAGAASFARRIRCRAAAVRRSPCGIVTWRHVRVSPGDEGDGATPIALHLAV